MISQFKNPVEQVSEFDSDGELVGQAKEQDTSREQKQVSRLS